MMYAAAGGVACLGVSGIKCLEDTLRTEATEARPGQSAIASGVFF